MTEFYPMKNILVVMLFEKLILLISSQVDKKKIKGRLIQIIENFHQAIISQEILEAVQNLKETLLTKR